MQEYADERLSFCPNCKRYFPDVRRVCPADGFFLEPIPSGEPSVGSTLMARYVLTEVAGVGGMANVFRAVDLANREIVALKLLNIGLMSDADLIERFFREARILKSIQHHNVVETKDFGQTPDGYLYISLELLEGVNLCDILEREMRLPVSWVLAICEQLCEALGAIHSKGIVHNDLKPENVQLILRDGEDISVKLFDFGIADLTYIKLKQTTEDDAIPGTPAYMSPEALMGEMTDPLSDLYSLGVMMYQLITGELPFEDSDPLKLYAMQMFDAPPRMRVMAPDLDIPEAVETLVEGLLTKDRDKRIPSVGEVAKRIEAALGTLWRPGDLAGLGRLVRDCMTEQIQAFVYQAPRRMSTHARQMRPPTLRNTDGARKAPAEPLPVDEGQLVEEGAEAAVCNVFLMHVKLVPEGSHPLGGASVIRFVVDPVVKYLERRASQLGLHINVDTAELVILDETAEALEADVARTFTSLAKDISRQLVAIKERTRAAFGFGIAIEMGPMFFHPSTRMSIWDLVRGSSADVTRRMAGISPRDTILVGPLLSRILRSKYRLVRWEKHRTREEPSGTYFYMLQDEHLDERPWREARSP